jgi:hypothetical protein
MDRQFVLGWKPHQIVQEGPSLTILCLIQVSTLSYVQIVTVYLIVQEGPSLMIPVYQHLMLLVLVLVLVLDMVQFWWLVLDWSLDLEAGVMLVQFWTF